jgi:hypothetical protein
MADQDSGTVHQSSDGGIAGSHGATAVNPMVVGTTTSGEMNLAYTGLIPVACWKVEDMRFAFDCSFVKPEISLDIGQLASLRDMHKKEVGTAPQPVMTVYPPISLFGHADPVGTDVYNKQLSGRRAIAIYALLTRKPNLWQQLYNVPEGGDNWKNKASPVIEQTLNLPSGSADGGNQLAVFKQYMDKVCTECDENGQPRSDANGNPVVVQLEDADFLAQGASSEGKGDYQGCSEFNPVRLFSQTEQDGYDNDTDHTDRDAANAPNRRVLVLLFQPGSQVNPNRWPCPCATEGMSGCVDRFWSDGNKRRSTLLPDQRREFTKTHDTFACRFYQRLTDLSPCEQLERGFAIYQITYEADKTPVANTLFEITFPDGSVRKLRSDADGMIVIPGVQGQSFTMIAVDDPKDPGTLVDGGPPKVVS